MLDCLHCGRQISLSRSGTEVGMFRENKVNTMAAESWLVPFVTLSWQSWWYWLCNISRSVFNMRMEFNFLCHLLRNDRKCKLFCVPWKQFSTGVKQPCNRACHLAAIAGVIVLVHCHIVKFVQLIERLGTHRFHLWVPNLQLSCSDLAYS